MGAASAYTYTDGIESGTFSDTTPPAPHGSGEGVGDPPGSMNTGDTSPPAPKGHADGVGDFSGFPDASGVTEPLPPVIDGDMPLNLGKTTGAL